jgi:CHASE2 domain-containing sensor protein
MKKQHWRDTFFCTLFIFGTLGLLYVLPGQFEVFNPLSEAFSDFELTDVVYSRHLGEDEDLEHIQDAVATRDTNIVLVNIGLLDRRGIAEQINIINQYQPKLIAIDALFEVARDPVADSMLSDAMSRTKNLVLGVKLLKADYEKGGFDSVQTTFWAFDRYAKRAFVNLITDGEDKFRVSRHFSPKERSADSLMLAFSTKIAQIAYPEQTAEFLKRTNKLEIINFRRHEHQYLALDIADVFSPNLSVNLKDKIVIMGYMGTDFSSKSWEDKFFTPLNEKYIGKTAPDMFGMTVHANIVSMIHEQHYIDEMPETMNNLIGVIFCLLNVSLFLYFNRKLPRWYDAITKAAQFSQILLLLYLTLLVYSRYRYKLDLSLAIGTILLAGDMVEIYVGVVKPKAIQLLHKIKPKNEAEVSENET